MKAHVFAVLAVLSFGVSGLVEGASQAAEAGPRLNQSGTRYRPEAAQVTLPFAELRLPPGTSFDLEELASRGWQATSLEFADGELWALSFTSGDWWSAHQELARRGFEPDDAQEGFAARVGSEDGDECLLVSGAQGVTMILSRPVTYDGVCPALDDRRMELPEVLSSDLERSMPEVAWGTALGSYNGVTAYSNGSVSYVGPYGTYGYQYQCVEYINRYYVQALGWKNMRGMGNANAYCSNTASTGLKVYLNNGTTGPKTGDILVSKGGSYGHVAIVREVGTTYVKVIEQNWCNCSSDANTQIAMTVSGGKYNVSGFSSSYPVACWARKP